MIVYVKDKGRNRFYKLSVSFSKSSRGHWKMNVEQYTNISKWEYYKQKKEDKYILDCTEFILNGYLHEAGHKKLFEKLQNKA